MPRHIGLEVSSIRPMWRNKSVTIGLVVALVVALALICYLVSRSSKTTPPEPVPRYPIRPPNIRRPMGPVQGHPQGHPQRGPPPSGSPQRGPPALVLFYAEWCGHSKQIRPSWKQAAQTLRQHGMQVIEMEDGKNKAEIQQHGVKGFPTIRFYREGFPSPNFVKYQGNRTPESIIKFARSGGQES